MSFLCSQILKTLCPCFFKEKRNLSHYGDNQLIERQEFIIPDTIDHDFDIKHKSQTAKSFEHSTMVSINQSFSQQKQKVEQKVELLQRHDQESQMETIRSEMIEQQTFYKDYTDVINTDHPYYDILYPKLQTLSSLFEIDQKYLLQQTTELFPLRIYCKQSEVRKTNIFVYFFQFQNTNYESYETLLNDFEVQKTFDPNINEYYKKVESPNCDTKIIYLSYNKMLIIAPRDFVYVRYSFKKGKQFWSVATSVPNEEQNPGKIRGQIVMTATKVIQQNNKIIVKVYSQVNMKMAIKPQMAKNRGKTQIKKYLQKCFKHLNENKSESIL